MGFNSLTGFPNQLLKKILHIIHQNRTIASRLVLCFVYICWWLMVWCEPWHNHFFFEGELGPLGDRGWPGENGFKGAKVRGSCCGWILAEGWLSSFLRPQQIFLLDWRWCPLIIISLLLFLSSRETKDYQGQGVSQENQGAPEEMCVVYNNIIIIDE